MPTTHQTLCKRQEGYKTEQRKRKESYKTIVSGKSRNGEVSMLVCSFITKDFVYSWVLESEKSSYAGSLSLMGERVYMCGGFWRK